MIGCYTVFIIFDILVVSVDATIAHDNKSRVFFDDSYRFLQVVQSILCAICALSYVTLFTWFTLLIQKNQDRYGGMMRQVIIFFSVMITMLTINFILELIFYARFSAWEDATNMDELMS